MIQDPSGPPPPDRRQFLQAGLLGSVAAVTQPAVAATEVPSSELDELTLADLHDGLQSGKDLLKLYLLLKRRPGSSRQAFRDALLQSRRLPAPPNGSVRHQIGFGL